MKEFAPGKINLALRVGKRRADGFHDVDMVMQSISLADTITLEEAPNLTLTIDSSALPCDERNLAYQAALVLKMDKIKPAVHIHIQKRIYLAAGLAGGSADAAGVLRILNRYYGKPLSRGQLEEAAAEIGSDVPFCIAGGTQRALGRGELMRPLPPSPTLWMVLAKPAALGVSTAEVYRALDGVKDRKETDTDACVAALEHHDTKALLSALNNDLEAVTLEKVPFLVALKEAMLRLGAEKAMMSGSGPTVFGLVKDEETACRLKEKLRETFPRTCFWMWLVRRRSIMVKHLRQIPLDTYKPLREVVIENIRDAILSGDFPAGMRLTELQLADEMGVSRTPIREAIRNLEQEGLVVMIPRRGAYVADVSIHDINEVYEIRTALETLAAGLAAERIEDSEIEEMDKYLIATRTYVSRLDYAKSLKWIRLSMMSSIRPAAINAA